ncbi:hypothetical protein ACHAXN_002933 [Cyclotella atomus]
MNSALNYINSLVTAANQVYEIEIDTHLNVAFVDLNSVYDLSTCTSDALTIMRTTYAASTWHHPVNLHHALLGRDLRGGIAYIGVLCRSDYGFGLTASIWWWFRQSGLQGCVGLDRIYARDRPHSHDVNINSPEIDTCGTSCPAASTNQKWSTAAEDTPTRCTHLEVPFLAKARLQVSTINSGSTSFRGPIDAILQTYRKEGIRALYGGFGAVIIGGTPGTVLYLTGYAFFRDSITSLISNWNGSGHDTMNSKLSHGQEFMVHFSSGMLAEAVTCTIYVPVDVVKERMQVQQRLNFESSSTTHYRGSWDAIKSISRTEGLRGIYKGYWATLASFGPFSALYFMFYERFKELAREKHQITISHHRMEDANLPFLQLVSCSAGAGALASWLTSPLDMAKLRLQVQRGRLASMSSNEGVNAQYSGMVDCLQKVYRDEFGLRGLFRGAFARVLHVVPATAVTMSCYEKCRSMYANALG